MNYKTSRMRRIREVGLSNDQSKRKEGSESGFTAIPYRHPPNR